MHQLTQLGHDRHSQRLAHAEAQRLLALARATRRAARQAQRPRTQIQAQTQTQTISGR